MKKGLYITSIILLLSINYSTFASKVNFDTSAICDIKGTITSIEFKNEYKHPCLEGINSNCPVGAIVLNAPAMYVLDIDMLSLSCSQEKGDPYSYEAQLSDKTNTINIYQKNINRGDTLEIGDTINGSVEFISLENSFTSYNLEKKVPENIPDNINIQEITFENITSEDTSIQKDTVNIKTTSHDSEKGFFRKIWEWLISLFQ